MIKASDFPARESFRSERIPHSPAMEKSASYAFGKFPDHEVRPF